MKKVIWVIALAISMVAMTSCNGVRVNGGEEAVLIMKPWVFGSGGVSYNPVSAGLTWCAISTDDIVFNIKPVQYTEKFDDIITQDNNPVDFDAYVKIQINKGQTPRLYEDFGVQWYKNNIQEPFRKMNRNLCSDHKMFDLTSNRIIVDSLENAVFVFLTSEVKKLNIPIDIMEVHIGKVVPPNNVIEETVKTAAAEQSIITQDANRRSELARKDAQTAKAIADKAYMIEMKFTNSEYLEYRQIQVQLDKIEMAKDKKNISITFIEGGITPVYNAK